MQTEKARGAIIKAFTDNLQIQTHTNTGEMGGESFISTTWGDQKHTVGVKVEEETV